MIVCVWIDDGSMDFPNVLKAETMFVIEFAYMSVRTDRQTIMLISLFCYTHTIFVIFLNTLLPLNTTNVCITRFLISLSRPIVSLKCILNMSR